MISKEHPFPSIEEAQRETQKRSRIITGLESRIQEFADALIVVGSMAYGKNYSVRPESDIDFLVVMEPTGFDRMFSNGLFEPTQWDSFAAKTLQKGLAQCFTIRQQLDGVKVEYHFYVKETQYLASTFEIDSFSRIFPNGSKGTSTTVFLDFSGECRVKPTPIAPFGPGNIQQSRVYLIDDERFVPYLPINNLVMYPDVRFTKDNRLYDNINVMWKNLAMRLGEENPDGVDLQTTSVLHSQPGLWAVAPDVRRSMESRQEDALKKAGINYVNSGR